MSHEMLTRKDLAARWNVGLSTVNSWIAEKKIKPNKITNMFALDYIESIEREGINLDTVSAFKLRALERENERLKEENAVLKGTLFQVAVTANEVAAKLANDMAG